MLKVLDLFSGIGGFSLAAEWAGFETIAFCEIEPFCQKVLCKHWPNVPIVDDVKELKNEGQFGNVDIITGGFPCQPFSVAGKQKGVNDERDLWPEMFRIIREFKPTWVVGENVANFVNMAFERTAVDLESIGYEVQPFIIPACAVEARHERKRVWIVAHAKGERQRKKRKHKSFRNTERSPVFCQINENSNDASDTRGERTQGQWEKTFLEERRISWGQDFRSPSDFFGRSDIPKPLICRMDDGFSDRVDKLKGLGNAIVPQVAYEIFKSIGVIENEQI